MQKTGSKKLYKKLLRAVYNHDLSEVKRLVEEEHADPHQSGRGKFAPFHAAVAEKDLPIMEYFNHGKVEDLIAAEHAGDITRDLNWIGRLRYYWHYSRKEAPQLQKL